ncbi:hypothetical protein B1J92_K10824g [Nakaseomyces glabratus]|nr:hypothetical protein B1J91_K10824g [Nakaseomyces glabratus]OXB47066.1 hypothetical protein B1J92_K10824g [Nakaseomyces glabratus]
MTIDDTSRRFEEDDASAPVFDKVYQNYMMPGLELYDARVTINHWQLRDCIKPSSGNHSKLYYIYDHSIRVLDTDLEGLRSYRSHRMSESHVSGSEGEKRRLSSKLKKDVVSYRNRDMLKGNLNVPSEKLVEFYFKPRCFTELNGLTACGGLVGSDDRGFPTNWNRLNHNAGATSPPTDRNATSVAGSNINTQNTTDSSPPAQPIKLARRDVLLDRSNYSNPNIWKGILSLYNQNTNVSMTFVLGQFINNCVTLNDRSNNQYDLYTCNNDGHMYQCDISNRDVQLVRRFSDLKFPLNNAALSHDSKTMIVSGDSNKFAIYRQENLSEQFTLNYDNQAQWGNSHSKIKRIHRYSSGDNTGYIDNIFEAPNGDHGFYNSFSENDLQFATLFQNGVCLIYDVRRLDSPLAEISSTRPHSHNGAFRVCRFSYGLDDLLFISEHQGRVHVVDTRNFVNHQIILIPDKVTPPMDTEEQNTYNTTQNTQQQAADYQSSVSNYMSTYNNARRRYSFPSVGVKNWEPWITPANYIPLQYLEPKILPFPKVIDKLTNESIISHYNSSQYGSSRQNSGSYYAASTDSDNRVSKRRDARNSFRIRRVSTSSKRTIPQEGNNSGLLRAQNQQTNQRQELHTSSGSSNGNTVFDDDDIYDAYQDVNTNENMYPLSGRFEPTINEISGRYNPVNSTVVDYSSTDFTEENNISGIDWVEDRNGSSLIIGTDYGIMRWNINSWARRSFSSYDFC